MFYLGKATFPFSRENQWFCFFFKVENNSLELTRIFKESFKDQRWAWEKSVRAEKRDRDAERVPCKFRVLLLNARTQPSFDQNDDDVDAETSLSLCISISLLRPYTFFSRSPLVFKTLFVLLFHPQASVRFRCALYVYQSHLRRAVTATALARYREDDSKKSEMCWYKRKFLNFFFFCQRRRAFSDALLLCLFGGEHQDSAVRPFLASSPLSIVKVDVSKISNRLPDYPTLKNNSHEAWKCSVTRKKYFERPHTAMFRR